MVFQPRTPAPYGFLAYAISKDGVWEIGYTKVLFGIRVRFGRTGCMTYVVDFCAGDRLEDQTELMRLVRTILLGVPETISDEDVIQIFPRFTLKPVMLDPQWPKLKQQALETLRRLAEISAVH